MTGNPYAAPAIVALAVILIACITYVTAASIRKDRQPPYQPEHTHRAVRARLRAEAAPADDADPGGEKSAQELAGAPTGYCNDYDHPGWEPDADYGDWRDEQPPSPPAVEVLTGPGARIAQTSQLTVNVLDRALGLPQRQSQARPGRPRARSPFPLADLGRLAAALRAWNPASGGSALDDTRPQPALIAWGGKTAQQVADELAEQHLGVKP